MCLTWALLPNLKQERERAESRPRPDFRKLLQSQIFRGLFGYRILEAIGRRAWFTMLPVLAGIHMGLDGTQIGLLVTTNAVVTSVLQAFTGRFMDRVRVNRRMVVVYACLFQVFYLVATPLAGEWWHLMAITAVAGVRVAVSTPASSAMILQVGRRHGMGQVMSLMATAMSIGMAIGPLLAGLMYDWQGIGSVFYMGAAVVTIAALWFALSTRRVGHEPPSGPVTPARVTPLTAEPKGG